MDTNQPPSLWSGQVLHFLALAVLLGLTWYLWTLLGRPFPFLFWLTISVPIVHQVFVWATWRVELNSQAVGKTIGFKTYKAIFFTLLIGRPIAFLFLAWADRESLGLDVVPRIIISITLLLPAVYTLYSVKKFFGFERAAGGDHFESKYRKMPLAKEGIFSFTPNGMYVFGFLLFWAIAIGMDSSAALISAIFSHAYIWIHYFGTEKPDMNYLYGS